MSVKNDSLLHIEEIVRIYTNSKYLERNVQWVLLILAAYSKDLILSQTSPCFYVSAVYKSFENTVGKEEIAHNEQFLLFPQRFPPHWRALCHFYPT